MIKLLTTLMAVLYFTLSSGIVFNLHYCMGKLSKVKLATAPKKSCKCGKKEENKGCCKTTHKLVKLEDSHKLSSVEYTYDIPFTEAVIQYNTYTTTTHGNANNIVYQSNAPPLINKQDTYLLNCVFRI